MIMLLREMKGCLKWTLIVTESCNNVFLLSNVATGVTFMWVVINAW